MEFVSLLLLARRTQGEEEGEKEKVEILRVSFSQVKLNKIKFEGRNETSCGCVDDRREKFRTRWSGVAPFYRCRYVAKN